MYSVLCSVAVRSAYFFCVTLTAIEEVSNLFQAIIFRSLYVDTSGSLGGTGILKILKISKVFMLSNREIETTTKIYPYRKLWYR